MYIVVGCGLSGAVIAQQLHDAGKKVKIIEKRDHIGGNCYDYIDEETGIRVSKYGAHLFHTNNERVWQYVNKFSEWKRWEHKVVAYCDGIYVPVPANITTVNCLLGKHITTSSEFNEWLTNEIQNNPQDSKRINNSEDVAISRIGYNLYKKLIEPYTLKQWNKHPRDLDKSVLERLPLRDNFNPNYFNDKYQALPINGYTEFIKNMIDGIEVQLNTSYSNAYSCLNKSEQSNIEGVFFTGPIDSYFEDYEKLEYRSIDFKFVTIDQKYFQCNSVVNYVSGDVPYTRIVEYKHFSSQRTQSTESTKSAQRKDSKKTIISYETPKDSTNDEDKYYPVPNKKNLELYEKYKQMADELTNKNNVHFIGRLANYKYFNMDEAIANALEYMDKVLS